MSINLGNSALSATVTGLRINYRVYYATSEDPEYPAQYVQIDYSKDEEYQRTGNGWQSKKFCTYPQELIIQLMSPMRVKLLQILSHQYKISSRIEMYYFLPPKTLQGEPFIKPNDFGSQDFIRVGYFQFDENTRSDFQAREMKSLHVDMITQYIKLVLYQPYDNKLNIFNQIGLVSVQAIGEPMQGVDEAVVYNKFKQNQHLPVPNLDSSRNKYLSVASVKDEELDIVFQEKLRELKIYKDKAAEADEYDKARLLRDASEKVKEYGVKVIQLTDLKMVAVENEDYETAKKIKLEIDKIKKTISLLDPSIGIPKSIATAELKQHILDVEEQNQQKKTITSIRDFRIASSPPKKFEESLKQLEVQVKEETKVNSSFIVSRNPIVEDQYKPFVKYEDQIIPALKNGVKRKDIEDEITEYEQKYGSSIKQQSLLNQDQSYTSLPQNPNDELTEEQLEQAGKLVLFFDKPLIQKMSRPQWQQREQALGEIIQNLEAHKLKEGFDTAMNQLLLLCMDEKIQQLIVQTVNLIDALLSTNKNFKFDNHERMLAFLLDKLSDPKLGKKAEEIFFNYLNQRKQEYSSLVAFIVSKNSFFNVQAQNSQKLTMRKLQILYTMTANMQNYEISQSPNPKSTKQPQQLVYPYYEVFQKLIVTIDHPTLEVRQISQKIVLEIYKTHGFDKIQDFISRLPIKILVNMVKLIPEAQPYLRMNQDQIKAANKANAYGGGGSFGWAPNLQDTAQKEEKPQKSNIKKSSVSPEKSKKKVMFHDQKEKQSKNQVPQVPKCQFCGIQSEEFAEGDNLDSHYLSSCLMLTNCPGCTQIIEISAVTSHLKKECTEKAQFKSCKTCKEVYPKDQIDEHQRKGGCTAWKPASQANRCPLCHKDISPLEKGWRDHLLNKICGKNERNQPTTD